MIRGCRGTVDFLSYMQQYFYYVSCNEIVPMASITERVKKHRLELRHSGMRPVQLWVPDTRLDDFAEECRRQCRVAAESDRAHESIDILMNEVLDDIEGWAD